MKLFCNCNSEWYIDWSELNTEQLMLGECRNGKNISCKNCDYDFWYNADYENMMFDLKYMNTIW